MWKIAFNINLFHLNLSLLVNTFFPLSRNPSELLILGLSEESELKLLLHTVNVDLLSTNEPMALFQLLKVNE